MPQRQTGREGDSSHTMLGVAPIETPPVDMTSWAAVAPGPVSELAGDERPRYRLGSRIAPSGQVYEAASPVHSGPLVVKLFPWATGLPAAAVAAFTDEATRVANLRHPYIVQVLRAGALDDGAPFTASERLSGQTLEERIAGGRPLGPGEVFFIVRGIASAVSAAHSAGVVHRELRADNVFMATVAGYDSGFPRVLDFGVSRLTAAARAAGRIVGPGTVAALAPEQRQWSLDTADERADQFSLAALTYRLLTGGEVSPGLQRGPAFERMSGKSLDQRARYAGCAPGVEAVLARAMSLQPEHRFDSVAAFLRALHTGMASSAAEGEAGSPKVTPSLRRSTTHTPTVRLSVEPDAAFSGRVAGPVPASSLTQQFFADGERQEADRWADSPLVEEDFVDARPARSAWFAAFNGLPRRRLPVIASVACGLVALALIGWATLGSSKPDSMSSARPIVGAAPATAQPPPPPVALAKVTTTPAPEDVTAPPVSARVPTPGASAGTANEARPPLRASPGPISTANESRGPLRGYVWSEQRRRLTRARPAVLPTDSGPPPAWQPPSARDLLPPSD